MGHGSDITRNKHARDPRLGLVTATNHRDPNGCPDLENCSVEQGSDNTSIREVWLGCCGPQVVAD